jgi:hypothetical protein
MKTFIRCTLFGVLFAAALTVVSCGGGGGGGGGDGAGSGAASGSPSVSPSSLAALNILTGTVEAPNGALAFYPQPSALARIARVFVSSAEAMSGTSTVPDGTLVELVRIDDAGGVIRTLATTTVTGGRYSFDLTSLNLASDSTLAVQVRNAATGACMRAFVTSGSVNIDPVSEALVRLVIAKVKKVPGGTLSCFTVQELSDLMGSARVLVALNGASAPPGVEAAAEAVRSLIAADSDVSSFLSEAAMPGQTSKGAGDIGNYMPMAEGRTWEIKRTTTETGAPTKNTTETVRITGTRLINGTQATVFQTTVLGESGSKEDYRVKTSEGVFYYGSNVSTDRVAAQVSPYLEYRFPLTPDSSFEQISRRGIDYGRDLDMDSINESLAIRSVVSVLGFESVTVAAGTFHACARVRTDLTETVTYSRSGRTLTVIGTVDEWFAPGMGLVKAHVEYSSPGWTEVQDSGLAFYNAGNATPAVVSAEPINTVSSARAATVSVTFSEEMKSSTVNGYTFMVRDASNNAVRGVVSYSDKKATFTPSSLLPAGTYTVRVSGVQNLSGTPMSRDYTWNFVVDTAPPSVVSTSPVSNATGVGIKLGQTTVTATFNKTLDTNSIDGSSVAITDDTTHEPVGRGSFYAFERTITCAWILERNTTYTVTIHSSVKDSAGNNMASDYSWSFTTEDALVSNPVLIAPRLMDRPDAVAAGDLNGDGRNDLVVADSFFVSHLYGSSTVQVFLQDTQGGLGTPTGYYTQTIARIRSIAIGDFNNDKRKDVVVTNEGESVQVFLQNASGGLDPGIVYRTADSLLLKVADMNNDGLDDVVSIGSGTGISVWYQNNGGTLNAPVVLPLLYEAGVASDFQVGDVNRDGRLDIVVTNPNNYNAAVITQKPDGTFNTPVYYPSNSPGGYNACLAIGDVNGDGLNDVAVVYWWNSCTYLTLLLQNGSGTFDSLPALGLEWGNGESVHIKDINNDGRNDVVVLTSGRLVLLLQQGDGTLGAADKYAMSGGSVPYSGVVADINNDGLNDIVTLNGEGIIVFYGNPPAAGSSQQSSGMFQSMPNSVRERETGAPFSVFRFGRL